MTAALYTLTSDLHSVGSDVSLEPFVIGVREALGWDFTVRGTDWSDFGTHDADLIYVRTGGTEGLFLDLVRRGLVRKENHVLLLTSGKQNSLAASMEILTWLHREGWSGEILHGSAEMIASKVKNGPAGVCTAQYEPVPEEFRKALRGKRAGIIGRPSDWLISSDVDPDNARSRLGIELVDVPMQELLDEVFTHKCDLRGFEGSEAVYEALKVIVGRYRLDGITLRCFDLLDTVHNTGCLALARLNAEGIPSSCEGDVPALITMMAASEIYGCPGFQCNLSRVEGRECLFAHCTVPLSMVSSFRYDTHFESGIGTAIKGEIPEGPVRIMRIAPDLEKMVCLPGRILRNQGEPGLCRTQIVVDTDPAYFLTAPLGNHHVIYPFIFP